MCYIAFELQTVEKCNHFLFLCSLIIVDAHGIRSGLLRLWSGHVSFEISDVSFQYLKAEATLLYTDYDRMMRQ